MKKIGFVAPWFSDDIKGGAEMNMKNLIHHLQDSGMELEVLTTCVKEFHSDWSKNYYKSGTTIESKIITKRFPVERRNKIEFDRINTKLMQGQIVSDDDEILFMNNMIHSSQLYQYIEDNQEEYELFVYTPYMFGITYEGVKRCPQKSILIPCFHDESYAYMKIYKECYKHVKGMIFNAKPEEILANKIYDLSLVHGEVLGTGVDSSITCDAEHFKNKFHIYEPYILYVGRKDTTKNVHTLIKYFRFYKKYKQNSCKLVMIGPGTLPIPEDMKDEIIDLGFVDLQDKYDAMAAATVLCQPSKNESFSLVIMESWLCGRPVMVHDQCAVTKNFMLESNGGLYFDSYFEFERELDYYLNHPDAAKVIGKQGREYVLNHFSWDVIVDKYMCFFRSCIEGELKSGQ